MAAKFALPAPVEQKLAALARQVRLFRWLRGLGLLTLVLASTFALFFALDLWFDFSEELLAVVLAGTAVLVVLVSLFGLLRPLLRGVDAAGLAAVIERHHPELAERLTSSVRLAQGDNPHGTATFIARLLEETESQTGTLVFRHAVSFRSTYILLSLALGVLLLLALPALAWPERFADFGQRFLLSWLAPPALQLEVAPGEVAAAQGRAFAVTVQVQRRSERVAWPGSAYLVLTDAAGRSKRVPLEPIAAGSFRWLLDRVEGSFSYHVVAGPVRSEEYRVTAVEPVELAEDSPVITLTPPAYVNRHFYPEERILPTTGGIMALQYSKIHWQFRFTRPAVKASVLVTAVPQATPPSGKDRRPQSWSLPINLPGAERDGWFDLPMLEPGRYTLTLHMEAEHGIATDRDLPEMTIRPDRPPFFTETPSFFPSTSDEVAQVAPGDALPISLSAGDAEGIGRVEVEYRINDGPPVLAALGQAEGQRLLKVEQRWELHGLVKDGDTVFFRVKVTDNRQVGAGAYRDAAGQPTPPAALEPQAIYYPAPEQGKPRWFMVRVDRQAKPLEKRQILAQQDSVDRTIDALKKKIIQAREKLIQLEQTSRYQNDLQDTQAGDLDKLEKDNKGIQADLKELAEKTSKVPELQEIGDKAEQLAQKEVARSGKALKTAQEKRAEKPIRQQQMFLADEQWAKALDQLDGLHKLNQQQAKARMDAQQLKQLAQTEKELADQAGKLEKLAKDDPKRKAELARLQAEQEKVAQELSKLAKDNPALQQALNQAQADEAKKLGQQAEELAKSQKALAQQAAQSLHKQFEDLLEEFAKKQQQIADQAGYLAQLTAKEVTSRQILPLPAYPAQNAVQALRAGQVNQALGQQKFTAEELDRVAGQLEESRDLSAGPREYVQKLARKQKDLEDRLLGEAQQLGKRTPDQVKQAILEIHKGQDSIERALQETVRSPSSTSAKEAHKEAVNSAARALKLLLFDPYQARMEMEASRQALESLAALLPDGAQHSAEGPGSKVAPAGNGKTPSSHVADLRRLAQVQRDLRQKLLELLGRSSPPTNEKGESLKQVAQKQEKLEKQADELKQKLEKMAKSPAGSKEGKKTAEEAAKSSAQAKQAMEHAKQQAKQGDAAGAKQSAEDAAQMLKSAAEQAKQAAKQMAGGQGQEKSSPAQMQAQKEASQALEKGQMQAAKAQSQLNSSEMKSARQAMEEAANALGQAAEQLNKQGTPGQPKLVERPGHNSGAGSLPLPDLKKYGPDMAPYTGKSWGQLPGELKTRILMDARAQYGPEYAEIIQRYFEGIADTKGED